MALRGLPKEERTEEKLELLLKWANEQVVRMTAVEMLLAGAVVVAGFDDEGGPIVRVDDAHPFIRLVKQDAGDVAEGAPA